MAEACNRDILPAVIVTVASFKGGVGKTTSAVHLAAYLNGRGNTVLIDGDANRSATAWAKNGGLPYLVMDEERIETARQEFEHLVIDTAARPGLDDLRALVAGCDLLVIPCTPDALALDALLQTVDVLDGLGANSYKILLTIIPPVPSRDGEEARAMLKDAKLPCFKRGIRRYAAFGKAALAGCLVQQVFSDPRSGLGWDDYQSVGREIFA